MTFSFAQWTCPNIAGGGRISGTTLMGLGALFMALSVLPGTVVRGALSRGPGVRATKTHRAIFFLVGAASAYEGAKFVFLCG